MRRAVIYVVGSLLISCLFSCAGFTGEVLPVADAEGSLGIAAPEITLVAVGDINLGRKAGRIILAGDVDYAFVEEGGRLVPRTLVLGGRAEGHFEVLSGLKAGERVVTWKESLIEGENVFSVCVRGIQEGDWQIALKIRDQNLVKNIIMPVKVSKLG